MRTLPATLLLGLSVDNKGRASSAPRELERLLPPDLKEPVRCSNPAAEINAVPLSGSEKLYFRYVWPLISTFIFAGPINYTQAGRSLNKQLGEDHDVKLMQGVTLEVDSGGIPLYKFYNSNGYQICTDVDEVLIKRNMRGTKFINFIRHPLDKSKRQAVDFVVADTDHLPFKDEGVDRIVTVCSVTFNTDTNELSRTLKRGGIFTEISGDTPRNVARSA